MTLHSGPSGAELAARRKAAGMTQAQLAAKAGIGRCAVSYWETRPNLDPRGWAVLRMAKALRWVVQDYAARYAHRRGVGFVQIDRTPEDLGRAVAEALARWQDREAQRAARHCVRCDARTRKGTACRNMSEPGKRRCKFHGGLSTGPKTREGREQIAEAQRRRWATAKAQRAGPEDET